MPIGSLSKLNSSLVLGLYKSTRFHCKNQVQQRRVFCEHLAFFETDISGHLSVKPKEAPILKSNCIRRNSGNILGVVGASQGHSSLLISTLGSSHILGYTKNSQLATSMAASGSTAASGDLSVDNFIPSCGNASNFAKPGGVFYEDRRRKGFQVASMAMRNREPNKSQAVHGYFIFDITRRASRINPFDGQLRRKFSISSSTCYSDGGEPAGSLKELSPDEPIASLAIATDEKSLDGRKLKLLSGSSYLPHPDKEESGGEDAHFICVDDHVIGVADGVGGWADVGVDAGEYSRALMSNSVRAIQDEPKEAIDPARVLVKAHSATKAQGSSTACIIALTHQGLHAINLGDSGFVVIRDGCTVFHSPVQQHDFNFTYQLASGNEGDLPCSGQVFNIPVSAGDVIVAGTDGLFDNLYNNEVTALVVQAVRSRLSPEALAHNIASLARQKAVDRKRQSPFSTAAQEAGYVYHGGKLDDITVVVSFVISSNHL